MLLKQSRLSGWATSVLISSCNSSTMIFSWPSQNLYHTSIFIKFKNPPTCKHIFSFSIIVHCPKPDRGNHDTATGQTCLKRSRTMTASGTVWSGRAPWSDSAASQNSRMDQENVQNAERRTQLRRRRFPLQNGVRRRRNRRISGNDDSLRRP